MDNIKKWIEEHPARAATIAGWYQQGCGLVAAFIVVPFILKKLSEGEAGLWFAFQTLLAIVTLTDFGFSYVIARQVAYCLGKKMGDKHEADSDFINTQPGWHGVAEIYNVAKVLFRRITIIGLVLLIIIHELVIPFTRLGEIKGIHVTLAWYLLGISTLVSLQAKLNQAVIDGSNRMYITKSLIGTFQLLIGAGVIGALYIYPKISVIASVILILSVCQFIALKIVLDIISEKRLKTSEVAGYNKNLLSKLWKIAAPIGIVSSASYCITSIQVPMVGAILGAAAVTPFYLAQRIAMVFMQAIVQIYHPQIPIFTMDFSRGDYPQALRRMNRTLFLIACVSFCAFLVFYIASPFLVKLWVGEGKYVTNDVLMLMSADYFILCVASVFGQFVLASGKNPFVISTLINAALNLILTVVFCLRFGLLGLPMATLISGLISNYWFITYHGLKLLSQLKQKSAIKQAI